MDRFIVAGLRAFGWLTLAGGILIGLFLVATAVFHTNTATSSFEAGLQSAADKVAIITGGGFIFGALFLFVLCSTVAIIADALLDIREAQWQMLEGEEGEEGEE